MYLTRLRLFNVSNDVLSSVPWVGTSRLVSIMDQVVQRGPNDQKTWFNLIRRADIILESFSSNNLSRMTVLLTKSSYPDQKFLEKLKKQSLNKIKESDLLSCCGFLYGFSKLGLCDKEIIYEFGKRVVEQLDSAKNGYPLVLILNLYSTNKDQEMVNVLLKELVKHMDTLKPQSFAMIIGDVISNFTDFEVFSNLEPFLIKSLNHINNMDLRSLVQLYSTFTQTNHHLKSQYLDSLAKHMTNLVQHASIHQLCIILRGYYRCPVNTELLQSVLNSLKSKYESGDLQELIFVLSHMLKLNLKDLGLTKDILCKIIEFKNINSVQFSNLVYICGKYKLEVPQIYITKHLERLKSELTIKDLALFSYGLDKLGMLEMESGLAELAQQMLNDPKNYNTHSHLMLKQTFNQLNLIS